MKFLFRGWGIPVLAFAFGILILTQLGINSVFADERYYQEHGWPKLLGLVLAAIPVHLLARYLDSRAGRVAVEKQSGGEIVVNAASSSSIPLKAWPVILVLLGIVMLFV